MFHRFQYLHSIHRHNLTSFKCPRRINQVYELVIVITCITTHIKEAAITHKGIEQHVMCAFMALAGDQLPWPQHTQQSLFRIHLTTVTSSSLTTLLISRGRRSNHHPPHPPP
ncbi:hypothetical protein Pelo_6223 [Pelomyxa schiedti]|nr:hypothetical protein Pelo_6223 [Pelomyxa schiedti]